MPFSDAYKNKILNATLNNIPVGPVNTFLGLFLNVPTTSSPLGMEVGDPTYQRLPITLTVNGNVAEHLTSFSFSASADWGFITGFGIFNGHSGNDLMFYDTWENVYLAQENEQYIINKIRLTFVP